MLKSCERARRFSARFRQLKSCHDDNASSGERSALTAFFLPGRTEIERVERDEEGTFSRDSARAARANVAPGVSLAYFWTIFPATQAGSTRERE